MKLNTAIDSYDYNQLINFWFSERVSKLWYQSTKAFDLEVEDKFSGYFEAACEGNLKHWQ